METKKLTPEIIELLNKPLPKEAIKQHPTKTYLSTIKAIYVVERLNECFGIGGWVINNEVVLKEGKWIVVKSTLLISEYGIVIPDIFGGNDNADLGDAYKGACTDALTKIGSYLGIGMDVYKGLADKPATEPVKQPKKKEVLTPIHSKWNDAIVWLKGEGSMTKLLESYEVSKEFQSKLIDETLK
jgi:hypothetical protein